MLSKRVVFRFLVFVFSKTDEASLLALCMYASLICATLFHCYASLRLNFYSAYLKWRAFSGCMVEDVYVQFNLEVHTCQMCAS